MQPKVSFIIAAFNEERYIKECVESCLDQTYKNIEVCITDDGSTDNTWTILKEMESEKVIISRLPKNRGKVPAFNLSFSNTSGEYIALIGADDVNIKDRIEAQLKFVESQNLDLTWGRFDHIDENGERIENYVTPVATKVTKKMILEDNFIPGGTMLFNRTLAKNVFPIPEDLRFEDWWISFQTVFNFKYAFHNQVAIKYRIHANSTVGNRSEAHHVTRRKNIKRHLLYHDLFCKKLTDEPKLKKLNNLAKIYKQVCLSDSLSKRIQLSLKAFTLLQLSGIKLFVKVILVAILGLENINKILNK